MRKILILLLSAMMVFGLTACKGGKTDPEPTPEKKEFALKVWCADAIVELTKSQLAKFAEAHKDEYTLTYTVEAVGEGDAATSMTTDVEAGGDIYCFAQDQLARLVQANALAKPGNKAVETIKAENSAGSVGAATFDNTVYAYPLTDDNGYFMYYDKTVVTDPTDLAKVLADCEAADRYFCYNLGSAWYAAGLFFATGCVSEWNMNGTDIVSYKDTFDSAEGLVSAKAMSMIVNSPVFVDDSQASQFDNKAAVVVSGTWDYDTASKKLGDNMGVAELPNFTVDGKTYHMGSFSGNKLMGVKPQQDAEKAAVASQVALYLTGEECQMERFNQQAWGPSNKKAAASDAVQANPGLAALSAQNNYAKPQGQYPGSWWDIGGAIKAGVLAAGANPSDDALKAVLKTYSDSLAALLTVDPEVARAFTVIGSFNEWGGDVAMKEDPAGTWTSEPIELAANAELKVRQGKSWDVNFGGAAGGQESDNYVVAEAGTYIVVLVYNEADGSATLEVKKQ
ncbi:MAG: extracellular solute-binding protein [Erysipelotrichales bacterium]|nr:extracellular solute-binding protein [Erysipelotrichales bacterium]MBQ2310200.1 extracellular solute-binding protein [Erysipelotrichales bacterium]MBQ4374897.1 extracellular solute-binding protein [Erysipelotrichales bacterium]MBQ5542498.1 extracellular solute-binding protein [Erysipelotrichales bacterium]